MDNLNYHLEEENSYKVLDDILGEENFDNLSFETNENTQKLIFEPDSLEGVASAYRYKLNILNPELEGCAFNFTDDLDVFNFNDVNKKRALKKEEWPNDSSLDNPRRYDVQIQLMAGNAEIKTCGGCSMWKDLTRKPFLMLTPHGNRCIQFIKKPFILMIFRCCPKFHSYAKQFKLVITITSPITGAKYSNEINIYRKKMNNSGKKRKIDSPPKQEEKQETVENVQVSNNEDSKEKFDATLVLHETLFPQQASLLKPPAVQQSLESSTVNPSLLTQCFPQMLHSDTKKQETKHRVPEYQLPFQHLQHEIDLAQQQFVKGQPQPQSSYSPQMLYDLLYKNPKTNPPPPTSVFLSENDETPKKKIQSNSLPLLETIPEPTNDETWIESLLNTGAYESTKEGFESYVVDDSLSFNSTIQLGF